MPENSQYPELDKLNMASAEVIKDYLIIVRGQEKLIKKSTFDTLFCFKEREGTYIPVVELAKLLGVNRNTARTRVSDARIKVEYDSRVHKLIVYYLKEESYLYRDPNLELILVGKVA